MKITQFAKVVDRTMMPDAIKNIVESFPEPEVTETKVRMRIKNPDMFEKDSFKTIRLTSGVQAVIARPKGATATQIQSVLFDKKKFSVPEAKAWLRRHKGQFSMAITIEGKKDELFKYDGIEVNDDNVLELLEEHIESHLPKLKPSGIQKILEAAEITEEDLVEYSEDMKEECMAHHYKNKKKKRKMEYSSKEDIQQRLLEIENLLKQ